MERTEVVVHTNRLVLKPWHHDDAAAALAIFGAPEVARWLSPAMEPVQDEQAMAEAIDNWASFDVDDDPPVGHWSATRLSDGVVVGSVAVRWMPPIREDLELAWQFAPQFWGNGYATEAAHAIARWAFDQEAHELFAVTRPGNDRAIKLANRLGMQWVGETEKYYDLRLQVFRLRPAELIAPVALPGQRSTAPA